MDELWIDKYRPRCLDDFTYNKKAVAKFKKLAQNSDIPHLCVEGIRGIGKKTMIMSFLKECVDSHGLTGSEVYKTQNMTLDFKVNNKDISLVIQKSFYHYNLNPSNYGIYDRHIVQSSLQTLFHYKSITKFPYKNFLIRRAEELSLDAQQSLRRTLEKCVQNCRFVFIINTDKQGGLIPALKSRCIRIRLAAPTSTEALEVINNILHAEGIHYLPDAFLKKFYKRCQGNLSRCLNLLQLAIIRNGKDGMLKLVASSAGLPLADICPVTKCCQEIIIELIEAKNPKIFDIRQKFYMLLADGINSEEIIKKIFKIALDNLPGKEVEVARITDLVEEQLGESSREFYHLENYILQLLCIIKHQQSTTTKAPSVTKKPKLNLAKPKLNLTPSKVTDSPKPIPPKLNLADRKPGTPSSSDEKKKIPLTLVKKTL